MSTDTCCSTEKSSVEQQAVKALAYLDDSDKQKVLEYISSLIDLTEAKNDEASVTKD
jgi:hypothetical protein